MDESLLDVCRSLDVNPEYLLEKVRQKLSGESPDCYLSAVEARVVWDALHVAAGI